MAAALETIKLPGSGKPLNARDELRYATGKTDKFPIAIIDEGYKAELLSTRDCVIMQLVNTITDKLDWHRKVYDEDNVAK
ncbi:MAG: hypothetical protein Q9222_003597 [Ikaeria aurantiellina]